MTASVESHFGRTRPATEQAGSADRARRAAADDVQDVSPWPRGGQPLVGAARHDASDRRRVEFRESRVGSVRFAAIQCALPPHAQPRGWPEPGGGSAARRITPGTENRKARYVDGYVLPILKKNVPAYRRIVKIASKGWYDRKRIVYGGFRTIVEA